LSEAKIFVSIYQNQCTIILDFFGPKMAISGAKKVAGPSKSLDFVLRPFIILEMAPFSDFIMSGQIYSTGTLIVKTALNSINNNAQCM
jgi:hypothetical protein